MTTRDVVLRAQLASMKAWDSFLEKCLFKRLSLAKFESFLPHLRSKHPIPTDALADLLLRPRAGNKDSLDPRIPLYLQAALALGYVDTPSVLVALYRYSTSHAQAHGADENLPGVRWRSSYAAEEVMFYRLTRAVVHGLAITKAEDAVRTMAIVAKWMNLFTSAFATFAADVMGQLDDGGARDEMELARAAFVALLISVCENDVVLRTVGRPSAKKARKAMLRSLLNFVPTLQNVGIADRLELFRSTVESFEPADKSKDAAKGIDELLDSAVGHENLMISELHIANSRAGLYIYLNACLVGRPILDEHSLFTYLHNRYQGDVQTAAIHLILASFDVLANAVFRNDGPRVAHLLRSYLINKLPLLLVTLGHSMFPPASPEFCITEALNQVDTNTFPTLSSMFDDSRNNNPVTDNVREEFCFACCLHDLMPQSHIETLLGENTYQTLPSGGRYVKDDLVRDCMASPEKIQSLVGELDNMDGNVGAVCQALTEVLARLCANKETMSLKILCSQLARKPLGLDVMLLFAKPTAILQPICDLLDNWRYEEDQNEYQPVYEEFGSILLLLLAFAYRYGLDAADLRIRSRDSFVAKLINQGHLSRLEDDLTEQERGHINGWIHGLFDTEAGGLGDELMSSCPPQDFYLLVPTLFLNIAVAFGAGALAEETLKGGLEYLVDTFLLPSLVPAIRFLSDYLCNDQSQEQSAVLRILQLLLSPSAISTEASTMLASVLNLVAKPLEHSLRTYQRRDPKNIQIEPLLRVLKDSLPLSRRTVCAEHIEMESWSSTHGGGLSAAIRNTVQASVHWSLRPDMNVMPASYTHRQVLCGVKSLGARAVLRVILDEVQAQSREGNAAVAFDVAAALLCAPDLAGDDAQQQQQQQQQQPGGGGGSVQEVDESGNVVPVPERRGTLREALKEEADDFRRIQRADPAMAEATVRLHRKVEEQMAPSQVPILQVDLTAELGESTAQAVANAAAAAAAQGGDSMQMDGVGMDLMAGVSGGDVSMGSGNGGGAGDGDGGGGGGGGGSFDLGDDIFGGLDVGGDPFDGWDALGDSMDLS